MKLTIEQNILSWIYYYTCLRGKDIPQDFVYKTDSEEHKQYNTFFITKLQTNKLVAEPRIYSTSLEVLSLLNLPVIQVYNPQYIVPINAGLYFWETVSLPYWEKVPWINFPVVYETIFTKDFEQ